jgi:hypothetical protein
MMSLKKTPKSVVKRVNVERNNRHFSEEKSSPENDQIGVVRLYARNL